MKYTLSFIFNSSLTHIIMVKKNRGPYPGCYNGIGGKIEEFDDSPLIASFRELEEETKITPTMLQCYDELVTCIFPSGIELYVFYGVLKENKEFQQVEDELLFWKPVESLMNPEDPKLAGEGNTSYFITASLINIKNNY